MKKKYLLLLISLMMLIILCACSGEANVEASQKATPESTSEATQTPAPTAEITPTKTPDPNALPEGVEHYNILLMGSSETDFSGDQTNAFTLTHILITIDPENRVLKFTTFPYNLMVDVETDDGVETGQLQFICNALGADGTVEVLEKNFGINIDHWVLMNMAGVSGVVDALGGIEVDLQDLSVNDMAGYVEHILGTTWVEVAQPGLQVLTGIQTAGYFFNTTYDNPTAEEEELRFREHHSNIINAVISGIKMLGISSGDLIAIAEKVMDDYSTDISDEEWQSIADSSLYCLENAPEFLHIPQTIQISDTNEWDILYDHAADTAAVQQFVGE